MCSFSRFCVGRRHFTRASIEVGYYCGPSIDILPAFGEFQARVGEVAFASFSQWKQRAHVCLKSLFQIPPNQQRGQTTSAQGAFSSCQTVIYLRCEAENDLGQISLKYGADLIQVLVELRVLQNVHSLLTSLNIIVCTVRCTGQVLKFDFALY